MFHLSNMRERCIGKSLQLDITLLFYNKIMAKISAETMLKVVTLKGKMAQWKIVWQLVVSRISGQAIQKIFVTTSLISTKKTRRPQKLDKRDNRKILRVTVGNPKLTAWQVRNECNLNCRISVHTVHRILWKATCL